MTNSIDEDGQPFRIAARAMRQLGAELITSDEMALYELIKNAFDARSPRAKVAISAPADAGAVALVREQLLGEKLSKVAALERLEKAVSVDLDLDQRAQVLDLFKENSATRDDLAQCIEKFLLEDYWIQISDSGEGMSASNLQNRFMVVGTPNKLLDKKTRKKGEHLVLGEKGIGRLSMMKLGDIAIVQSKTEGERYWHSITFDWRKFDDPAAYLGEVKFQVVRGQSDAPEVQGTVITIRGLIANWSATKVQAFLNKFIRRLQDPVSSRKRPYPIDVLLNGHRLPIVPLPRWLTDCAQFRTEISYTPGDSANLVALRRDLTWKSSTSAESRSWTLEEISREAGVPIEICRRLGPFSVSCLWFNRSLIHGGIEHSKKKILDELNVWCGGFAIYRDGFRVGQTGGMDDDWLEWDAKALRTKGFTLNRYQTVGSVNISSETNPYLVDAANRERLVSCPEQDLLVTLLGDVIVRDLRAHIDAVKQLEVKHAIEEESTDESLRKSEDSLRQTLRNVEEIGRSIPAAKPKVDEIRRALQGQVEYVETIRNALQLARETRVELLELANIGLVVEIVVHELTRLTQKTGELLSDLKKAEGTSSAMVSLVDNLQSQITATNKRIRSIDVMSPSGRNRKERYDVIAQARTVVSGFDARFKRHQIEFELTVDGEDPAGRRLDVQLVRGLIAQVLENLLTNSVYWVQQSLREPEVVRCMSVDIDSKAFAISVSDNGPGIDPAYREDVFKPYFTTRKRGKGLGLYIARELVEYHGGKLYLDSTSDVDGRLRTFVLELPREG